MLFINKRWCYLRINDSIEHGPLRAKAYPDVGEQLDAIYKGFAHLDAQGIDVGGEAKQWIEDCRRVKQTFKKVDSE